jgi:hypothetical protein
MNRLKLLQYPQLLLYVFFANFCSAGTGDSSTSEIVFVASTPGDEEIKSLLTINTSTTVDFIRWNLTLRTASDQKTFLLNIVFGESQPNTLGFKGGGEKLSFEGGYSVSRSTMGNEIYHLKSANLPAEILLVKVNENIMHVLTAQKKLMIGNGGWSYTLNRKDRVSNSVGLPVLTTSSALLIDPSPQITFDGRTPCQDFANDHKMDVSPSCFKLKWRVVLNRNPITHEPTTYTMRKVVDNVPRDVTGNWTIIKGVKENPNVIIYRLDPEDTEKAISLLVGDENVIFFLTKNNELYLGDGDFSFALNKRVGEK